MTDINRPFKDDSYEELLAQARAYTEELEAAERVGNKVRAAIALDDLNAIRAEQVIRNA